MRNHCSVFAEFWEPDLKENISFDNYIQNFTQSTECAREFAISAVARVLNQGIKVYCGLKTRVFSPIFANNELRDVINIIYCDKKAKMLTIIVKHFS